MAAQIKCASLINTMAILREVLGMARYQQVLQACPPDTQRLLRRTLIAVEWISLPLWSPFVQAVFDLGCGKDEQVFRRLLRAVCKRDFSTVYRGYLNMATPDGILAQAASIWSVYYDTGSLTVQSTEVSEDKTLATLQLRDLATDVMLHALTMQAYLEQLLILAGARRCTVQRAKESVHDGKLSCEYLIEYAR